MENRIHLRNIMVSSRVPNPSAVFRWKSIRIKQQMGRVRLSAGHFHQRLYWWSVTVVDHKSLSSVGDFSNNCSSNSRLLVLLFALVQPLDESNTSCNLLQPYQDHWYFKFTSKVTFKLQSKAFHSQCCIINEFQVVLNASSYSNVNFRGDTFKKD